MRSHPQILQQRERRFPQQQHVLLAWVLASCLSSQTSAFSLLLPSMCLGNWEPSLPGPYLCSLQQHRNDVPVQFILLLLGKLMSRGTAAARRNSFPAVLREKSAGLGPGSNLIVQHICYANHLGEGESNQSGNQLCLRQKRTVGTRRRLSCSL